MSKPANTDDDIDIPLDLIANAYPAIADAMRRGTPAQRHELRKAAHFYQREFIDARRRGAQPAGVAAGQHDLLNDVIADTMKKLAPEVKISCRAGCSACCYQAVHVTDQEAQLLTMYIHEKGVPYDYERAARQATWAPQEWRNQTHADRACGFLADDGRCAVYEVRPLVCRKYVVSSDPELCDTELHPGAPIQLVTSIQAELIVAAAHVSTEGSTLPQQMMIAKDMP
jgi:Fe-S-cluster containining protein